MPQIKLYNSTLKDYVDHNRQYGAAFKLIEPLPSVLEQYGHTCKLCSLSIVMNWRYLNSASTIAIPPPPALKRDRKDYKATSLRKEAKNKYGSAIGEIYHPDVLVKLAQDHEYTNSRVIECTTDNYKQNLIAEIDAGNPAIVFFDVDTSNGHPINSASRNEHSAVIVGYFHDYDNVLSLIAVQWGAYYKISMELLKDSANQLSAIREPETFYKFGKDWRQREDRRDKNSELRTRIAEREYSRMFTTKPVTTAGSGFKNKILIIDFPAPRPRKKLNDSVMADPVAEQKTFEIQPVFSKKFIPLDELINFIEIDTIRHDTYSNEKLKEFADFFAFDNEMKELTTEKYNTQIDETLDDDIYRQNPKRNRSITELVSNAIDAAPERIIVTLKDGEYEVKDVRGKGMSPAIIFRKLILTKSTSKEDLSDNIGRFGLGFYTALAHLDSPHDFVLVETKDAGFPGYSIEYRKISGKIQINISPLPSLQEPGTRALVHAKTIKLAEFSAALIENVEHHVKTPIILNGELINSVSKGNYHTISDSTVILKPDSQNKNSIISIGGITIKSYQAPSATNTMQVVWDLPKYVTLSESRNQVRIDSDQVRNEIRQLINFGLQFPRHLQVTYFNTIAPTVENLQEHNTSTHSDDDVLEYLQDVTAEIFKDVPQVPDLQHLAALNTHGTIMLHPAILEPTWEDRRAYLPEELDAHLEKARVRIIPMNTTGQEIGLIHDEDTNTIYIATKSYERILAANELWKLTSIFKHPKGEFIGHWSNTHASFNRHNAGLTADEKISAPIEHKFKTGKHHNLYEKHGVLHALGDDFISSLPADIYQRLYAAPVLIKSYPVQPIHTHSRNFDIYKIEKLTRYSYAGQTYYLAKISNHQDHLLNHNFQPVFHFKDMLLFEKIKQLHEADKTDCEVFLTENDRMTIAIPGSNTFKIYDGTGKQCVEKIFEGHGYLEIVNENYYIVHDSDHVYFYHLQRGLLYTAKDAHQNYKVFCKEPLIILINKSYQPIQLVHVENKETLPTDGNRVELCSNYYISYIKPVSHDNLTGFTIYDLTGQLLFSYSDAKEGDKQKIIFVHCQKIDSLFYISLIRNDKKQELFIAPYQQNATYADCKVFNDEQVIGYPVLGYIDTQADGNFCYKPVGSKRNQTNIKSVACFKTATATSERLSGDFYTLYSRDRTIEEMMQRKLFLLTGKNIKVIIDDRGHTASLPRECLALNLEMIKPVAEYYLLVSKKNLIMPTPKDVLIDRKGKFIASGDDIQVIKTLKEVYFSIDNKCLLNLHGKVILNNKFEYIIPHHYVLRVVYAGTDDEKKQFDLINQDGISILDHRYELIFGDHPGYFDLYDKKNRFILTPHALIPDGHITKYRPLITCHNIIYNAHGYPAFQMALADPVLYCHDIIGDAKYQLYVSFTASQLQSPAVLQNISYLNSFKLNSGLYANCLRFAEAEPVDFKDIYPYIPHLLYTPTPVQAQQYASFFRKIDNHSSADKLILVQLLNTVYSIAGTYTSVDMAEKIYHLLQSFGIRPLKRFLAGLQKKTNVLKLALYGVENERALINDMPQELAQFIYFIFSPDRHLLTLQKEINLPKTRSEFKSLSLLDLYTAQRLDKDITRYTKNKSMFYAAIAKQIQGCRQHHLQRKINHAIYHQAHPEKFLYLREFLQNAIDSYADIPSHYSREIPLHISKNDNNICVISLGDRGKGMTVEDVFAFLLIPGNSTKRHAEKGKFIGGRGVGLFTAFHNAERLQLKTSTGDGETHYFILTPVYEILPNNEQRVVDILIDWETVQEYFQGLTIERVSLPGTNPSLEAAKYQRAISTHARFIDGNIFDVTINGIAVNKPMPTIMEFSIPEFGNVKFYKSKEHAITGGGLYIKDLPHNFFEQLPNFVKNLLTKKGMVIDLPKSVALNRERNDFESTEAFTAFLLPHIYRNCYAVYINLFSMGFAKLPELPYDFFDRFRTNLNGLTTRNPDILIDADILNIGGVLEDYSRYSSPQLLTDLLCFLNLIPLKTIDSHTQRKMSLVAIARLFHADMISEAVKQQLPKQILDQMDFAHNSMARTKQFDIIMEPLDHFRNLAWIPRHFNTAPHWQLFMEISGYVLRALSDLSISLGLSTRLGNAIASTGNLANTIYWNPVNVMQDGIFARAFFGALEVPSEVVFQEAIAEIIDIISHELVHISDAPCTGNHNRTFELKQRDIQLRGLMNIDFMEAYAKFSDFHAKHLEHQSPLILEFLESQLGDFVKSKANQKPRSPSLLFSHSPSPSHKKHKPEETLARASKL